MANQILALIPARGGSKGVPRKNVMMLDGKPMIAYSILQAQASQRINRVVVSTDDEEIAAVAREWGAEVPFMRPAEYAQDLSPDIDVFRHALTWLRDNQNYEPEMVVHLRPTQGVLTDHGARLVRVGEVVQDRVQASVLNLRLRRNKESNCQNNRQ